MKIYLKTLLFWIILLSNVSSQPNWNVNLDKNPEWISLVNKYFGDEFTYIGTRKINNNPHVLLFDRSSVNKKGDLMESDIWQLNFNDPKGDGIIMKMFCDCHNYKTKITYLQEVTNTIGVPSIDEPWYPGVGDGISARILLIICNLSNEKFEYVNLILENGIFKIPIKINEQIVETFIFDTGASDLLISNKLFNKLKERNLINSKNYIGVEKYITANGEIETCEVYLLRTVSIGSRVLENIRCAVSNKNDIDCLLGQSFLKYLGKYEIDNESHTLILK